MSEADINRWHETVQPPARKPAKWTIGSGGSWDIAPIPDEMLSELTQRFHYAGTPWNCRSMPLSPSDREYMYLLYLSMQGLVARMRLGEKMVGEALTLLDRCSSEVTEEKRATDAEWDQVVARLRLYLSGKFEELRT